MGISVSPTALSPKHDDSMACETDLIAKKVPGVADATQCRGRHSRLRKDLINLNKAVAKWLRQADIGTVAPSEISTRIMSSSAAKVLQGLHGENFDQVRFVQEVLERSGGTQKVN